ncbi:MAG: hypothetical protein C6P37_15940 [Caldibacillus debilis]|uniref:Uncharacterized protein n=1 Tax=Caldibacillus debilis TaxID=301148 RepID=A0A3E0JWZ5_9BACI|nr:MAG: hypothetical protein C6P37_15940 [Caldibacillus debilis]
MIYRFRGTSVYHSTKNSERLSIIIKGFSRKFNGNPLPRPRPYFARPPRIGGPHLPVPFRMAEGETGAVFSFAVPKKRGRLPFRKNGGFYPEFLPRK